MAMISVQPSDDERNALRRLVLQYVAAMGDQLAAMAAQTPPAPGYLDLRSRQQTLLNYALTLETQELRLLGSDALGAAVDAINAATQSLQEALARQQAVARDIALASAAVAFVGAVLGGNPHEIIEAAQGIHGVLVPQADTPSG